jgi:hypothetical protein
MSKRLTWKDKAILATHNGQSRFGCILLSAMGRDTDATQPRFDRRATVTSDGFVICGFLNRNGEYHMGAFVGAYSDLLANCTGLAKHLKLTAKQSAELLALVVKWAGLN